MEGIVKTILWFAIIAIATGVTIAIVRSRRNKWLRRIRPGLLAEAMVIVLKKQPRRIGIPAVVEGYDFEEDGYTVIHRPLPNTKSVEIRSFEGTILHIQFLPGKQVYALGGPLTPQEHMAAEALFQAMEKKEKNL